MQLRLNQPREIVLASVRVVFVEPEHEGNIGAVARVMKNFDLGDLWLVKPRVILGIEAHAYAVNAKDILLSAHTVSSLTDALRDTDLIIGTTSERGWSSRNVLRTPMDPKHIAREVVDGSRRVALVFGRESKGLANRELDLCDMVVTIPSSSSHPTLNVATAAAILFYELFVASREEGSGEKVRADEQALRTVEGFFEEICGELSLTPHKRELTMRAFRNILHRSYVSQREASLLMGMMRRTKSRLTEFI